ncbi:hypothetical protein M0813_23393 [Anaeramoeba flamelloides]|uniref:Uncharacterized protein n=1 Tax=Anaeramoeba flamelloides TaxID=1746091 RepID=A0ABQ8YAG4_9EUKA|nr:hypothetical protein M0813_23393 [Anaeramoeba flamelloides]
MAKKINNYFQNLSNLDVTQLQDPTNNREESREQKTLRGNQSKSIRQNSLDSGFKCMKIKNLRTQEQESKCECRCDSKEDVLWLQIPTCHQIETVYSNTSSQDDGMDNDNDNESYKLKASNKNGFGFNISLSDLELEQKMIEDEDQQELLEIEKLLKDIQINKKQAQIKLKEDLSQVLTSTMPNKVQEQTQEQENSRILYCFEPQVKIPTLDQFKKTREEYLRAVIGDEIKDEIKYSPRQLKRIRRKRHKLKQEQEQNQTKNQKQKLVQQKNNKLVEQKKSRKKKHC